MNDRAAAPRAVGVDGKGWLSTVLPYAISIVVGVTVWALVARRFHVTTFPSPLDTIREAIALFKSGQMAHQAYVSIRRIVAGFALATAIGVPIGLAMGVIPFVRRMLEPITEFFRFIPAISMIVFSLLWFGVGEMSKIFLVAFSTLFIVIINTEAGVNAIGRNPLRAAQMLGATPWRSFIFVVVPFTVPYIITGMRIAMGRSFTTIVAAEMVGASAGLGFMIFGAREFMKMDTVLVGIVVLGLLGLTADVIFRLAARYFGSAYLSNREG